jgi:hypothetical protein
MTSMKPGSWPTPISASLLAVAGNRNKDVQVVGDDLWWDEMRPSESGRGTPQVEYTNMAASAGTVLLKMALRI